MRRQYSAAAALDKLNEAEVFETFLQTKFVGQKRVSLEGAESVIPLLDAVLSASAGVPAGHAVAVPVVDVGAPGAAWPRPCRACSLAPPSTTPPISSWAAPARAA